MAGPVEIPEEDYTTYGPDFVDCTRRWARAEVQRDMEASGGKSTNSGVTPTSPAATG